MRYEGSRIKALLQAQGRTQEWLADVTDYNAAVVSDFLRGARPVSDRFAERSALHLGVPVDWLAVDATTEAVPA